MPRLAVLLACWLLFSTSAKASEPEIGMGTTTAEVSKAKIGHPVNDNTLFMAGMAHFRRGEFRVADQIFTTIIENIDKQGRKSEFRDRVLTMAILSKSSQ